MSLLKRLSGALRTPRRMQASQFSHSELRWAVVVFASVAAFGGPASEVTRVCGLIVTVGVAWDWWRDHRRYRRFVKQCAVEQAEWDAKRGSVR